MIRSYLPALVFLGLGAFLGLVFATINSLLGPKRRPAARSQADPYECGLPSDVKQNFRFGISFYLVAMLFILFDIETIFLFPWAVAFRGLGVFGLIEMAVFVALVFVAYAYIWRKGGFDWAAGEIAPNEAEEVIERERALQEVGRAG